MKSNLQDIVEYKQKIIDIPLGQIEINKLNPRKRFVDTEADSLIESIITKGLLNPIIVYKKTHSNKYVILDGERRYNAFKKLNETTIPCLPELCGPLRALEVNGPWHCRVVPPERPGTELQVFLFIERSQ